MVKKNTREKGVMQVLCIDDLVPAEHIVRKIDDAIDFDFIYDEIKDLYCEDNGRPSIDPVTLFKIVLTQYMFGIRSMRQTIKEIEVNMAYRWFCNLDLMDAVPHFSTFNKNYERRFKGTQIFENIFERILIKCIEHNFVDTTTISIDATHIKASANKRKKVEKYVAVERRNYQSALEKEIDEEREKHGKKAFDRDDDDDQDLKKITQSTTDPESGEFHKGEHEKCFAYSAHTVCDKKGFVLKTKVTAGNIHDSKMFSELYQSTIKKHEVDNVAVDSGYKTPAIAKEILDSGKVPAMPYSAPKGGKPKDNLRKNYYWYEKETNTYISPTGEIFAYSTTDRNGYRIYRCKGNTRVITRHIWQDYIDEANRIRLTPEGKEIYSLRKETIERAFGDAKEKHAMRWTTLRGLANIQRQVTLTFACLNLKKLATWLAKSKTNPQEPTLISQILTKIAHLLKKFKIFNYQKLIYA